MSDRVLHPGQFGPFVPKGAKNGDIETSKRIHGIAGGYQVSDHQYDHQYTVDMDAIDSIVHAMRLGATNPN